MITAAEVRAVAMSLPRTEEHLIRDYIKFRVGKIVYASISPDELTIGFGFPKEQRAALVASEPDKFALPRLSDQRFHWVHAQLTALSPDEMPELVIEAWRMVVPKKVAAAHLGARDADGALGRWSWPAAYSFPGIASQGARKRTTVVDCARLNLQGTSGPNWRMRAP
jgi:hypothetical protein